MADTQYITELNYQNPCFNAGSVFTADQWVDAGGSTDGLKGHVSKGYIKVWEGQEPPVPMKEAVDVVEEVPVKVDHIWDFAEEDLEPLPLEALNSLYKDHAAKFGIKVRAYKDKEAVIKKMTSEA